jgi:hypothetical protein
MSRWLIPLRRQKCGALSVLKNCRKGSIRRFSTPLSPRSWPQTSQSLDPRAKIQRIKGALACVETLVSDYLRSEVVVLSMLEI